MAEHAFCPGFSKASLPVQLRELTSNKVAQLNFSADLRRERLCML